MTAHSLDGPWFNFKEIAHKTGLVKNEILYTIQMEAVTPVIYSDNRPFLAYSRSPDNRIIGHAHFRYAGPLAVDTESIQEIVREGQTLIGQRPVSPLCAKSINEWLTDYPYDGQLPNGLMHAWEPKQLSDMPSDWLTMLFPFEYDEYSHAESSLVEHLPPNYDEEEYFDRHAKRYLLRSLSQKYVYGTEFYSAYRQKDFRLPVAALSRLLVSINNPPSQDKNLQQNRIVKARQRTNELHQVIDRIAKAYPRQNSLALWKILRKDCELDQRQFDRDEIITRISKDCIYWTSTNGKERTMQKNSFQTAVCKLRKNPLES